MSNSEENQVSEELFNTEDMELPDEDNNAIEDELKNDEIENTEENEEFTEIEENLTEMTEGGSEQQAVKKKAPQERITNLPIAKIKHIIKLDPEVKLVNSEAVFLITKCTEYFIKLLAKESFGFAVQNKKKTITKGHVDSALTMLPVEL